MNPMDMMQFAGRINTFKQQHPKFGLFLKSVASKDLEVGSIMEVKFRNVDGEEYVANIRMTAEDIEMLNVLRD